MKIKISNSQIDTYETCAKKWYLQHRERLIPTSKGSALCVGVAFDAAFNDILLNHSKQDDDDLYNTGIESFFKAWEEQEDKYLGKIQLAKNPDIIYSKKDFEEGILTEEDGNKIEEYFQDIRNGMAQTYPDDLPFQSGYELFHHLREQSKDFINFGILEKTFYNYVNWLSIRRKAPYIIEAYIRDFLPLIDKVVSVQDQLSLESDGDSLVGVADFVVQLKPGKYNGVSVAAGENLIADNKSSARAYLNKSYGSNSVRDSHQLAKYKEILNQKNMNIDKGAYFVFVKELLQTKNKTCKSCGNFSQGLAKTCDAKPDGKKRCGGEWSIEISYDVETRIVVDHIPDETIQAALNKVDETINSIREEKFDPNYDSCNFQFGNRCPYFDYCESGCEDGLIRVEKK